MAYSILNTVYSRQTFRQITVNLTYTLITKLMKLHLPQALFTATLAALAAVPAQAADTYTWNGPAGTNSKDDHLWTGTHWLKNGKGSDLKWSNGWDAILPDKNKETEVKFSGAGKEITAGAVTVNGTYKMTCDDNPTIKFAGLTVNSGSALTIGGSFNDTSFTIDDLTLGGSMTIRTAMNITKISELSGTLTLNCNTTAKKTAITIGAIGKLGSIITTATALKFSEGATIAVTDKITVTGGEKHLSDGSNGFTVTDDATMTLVTIGSDKGGSGSLDAKEAKVTRNIGDDKDGIYTLDNTGVATKAGSTDFTTYYLNSGDGSVAAMKTASGNKLTTVDMSSTGTLTVDADLNTLNAHTQGGTVDMTLGKAIANMTVNADTTILTAEGKTVETTMEVESGKEVSIEGEGGIKTGGVVIAGRDNETPATITNRGESANYTPGNQYMEISQATVEVTDGSAAVGDLLTINNKLTNTKLINKSGVTVRSTDGAGLTDIAAISGNVAVTNLAALSLETLTIAAGEQVGVYTGNEMTEAAVAELTVTGTLTVGGAGASLNANLTLGSGSVLDLSAGSALTLGCTLGLEDGLTFVLSEQQLNDLTTGGSVLLMDGVDALSGTLPTSFTVTDSVGQAFGGPVALTYQGTELRLVPEPATATLSLLALAGLAARRRRK